MTKVGYVLVGAAAFVACAVLFAPARIATGVAARYDGVALQGAAGTLWNGEAHVLYKGFDAGHVAWSVVPSALFAGALGVDWRLTGAGYEIFGDLRRTVAATTMTAAGAVAAAPVNRVLGKYEIRIAGDFELSGLAVQVEPGGIGAASGELRWSGGGTVYRLSGQTYAADFPPMVGRLSAPDGELMLKAVAADSGTPLIESRLDGEGWLHIGITKRFTTLAGKPWQGGGADDDVVLTVAEKLL